MDGLIFLGLVYFVFIVGIACVAAYIAKAHPDHYQKMVETDKAMKRKAAEAMKQTVGPALIKAAFRLLSK